MGVKFNPFTGNLDLIDTTAAAGADTQVQYNNGGSLAGSADLTWDDTAKELGVGGDINLDDGGTYATTLQLITPTANRTISFPDATGTVALVGGSSGQLIYNNAGAYAGAPSTSVGATGNITLSLAGAASTPPVSLTGTWFSGGTSTTTKPQLLIEPTGTTSTAWSTGGTGLGVNAPSGFGGNLLDLQVNGSSKLYISNNGNIAVPSGSQSAPSLTFTGDTNTGIYSPGADQLALSTNGTGRLFVTQDGSVLIGNTGPIFGNTGTQISASGTASFSRDSGYPLLINRRTTDGTIVEIRRNWTTVGTISVTTTATAYNTSSDYRLKENVTPVTDGIARLQQLKPSRFNFIADPDTVVDGFIAHEVQTIVPEAITGEKDAVDDEGNPVYQGIDQSKLVPLLTAALQEAVAKIETLEARLTAAGI